MQEQLSNAIFEAIDDFGPDFDEEGNELEEGESDRIKDEDERQAPGRTEGSGDSDDSDDDESDSDSESDDSSEDSEDKEGAAA
jgi:hypothetical protein